MNMGDQIKLAREKVLEKAPGCNELLDNLINVAYKAGVFDAEYFNISMEDFDDE